MEYGWESTTWCTRSEELKHLATNLELLKDPTTGDQEVDGKGIFTSQIHSGHQQIDIVRLSVNTVGVATTGQQTATAIRPGDTDHTLGD